MLSYDLQKYELINNKKYPRSPVTTFGYEHYTMKCPFCEYYAFDDKSLSACEEDYANHLEKEHKNKL